MEPVIGHIMLFAGDYAPEGWLICDGRLLPLSDPQILPLASLIENTYGGDNIKNIALPDLRGALAIGMGAGPGLTPREIGKKGGAGTVTLTTATIPAHSHPVIANTTPATTTAPGGNLLSEAPPGHVFYFDIPSTMAPPPVPAALGGDTVMMAGGSQAHNNMMPSTALHYVICARGNYPEKPL